MFEMDCKTSECYYIDVLF